MPDDDVAVQLGHPEVLRILDPGEQDLGVGPVAVELFHELGDPVLDEVVSEEHDEGVVAQELPADLDRVGQSEGGLLLDVGRADAELGAVPHRGPDLLVGVPDHDSHLGDAGVADGLDAVEKNGFVGDGHQLFGAGEGDRSKPGALAAAQDQRFDGIPLRLGGIYAVE